MTCSDICSPLFISDKCMGHDGMELDLYLTVQHVHTHTHTHTNMRTYTQRSAYFEIQSRLLRVPDKAALQDTTNINISFNYFTRFASHVCVCVCVGGCVFVCVCVVLK